MWTFTGLGDIPWANRDGPPGPDSLFALIWSVTAESPIPKRSAWRGRDVNANVQTSMQRRTAETYWQPEYDGHITKLAVPYAQETATQAMPGTLRYGLAILLAVGVLIAVHFLTSRVAHRLFGSDNVFRYGRLVPKVPLSGATNQKEKNADFYAIWRELGREDRLLLHQLSKNRLINPTNTESIKRLAQKGLIKFDPWPKIADDSFKAFVETAEDQADFATWQSEASKSVWNSIRTPLLILLLIVVGLFLWLSSTSMQIVMTVLAGLATLLGYLGQAQNFIRGGGGPKGS